MANLINPGNISLNSAGWQLADTGGAAATLTTNNTTTTTSSVASGTFTLTNTKVTDGVLLHLLRTSSTGTFTVELFNGASVVATCTVNCSALPTVKTTVFFKWAVNYTSLGAATMSIRVKSSTNATVTVYRNSGTAADWYKLIRITDTATPAAADVMFAVGEINSSSTVTAYTVTQNNTAATIFGAISVGWQGLLSSGITGGIAYLLKMAGNLNVWNGGELRLGNVSNPVPSGSTSEIFFSNSSNVDFGITINAGGIITTYGVAKTKYCLLAANAAGGATSLTLDQIPTGWANGDTIALASTTVTATQTESKALTADVTTTTASVAAITNAHTGTTDIQGEVINLNRNVKIHGTSTSLQSYLQALADHGGVSIFNTEFYNMGGGVSATTGGIVINTGTVDSTISGCAMHDWIVANGCQIFLISASGAGRTTTFQNNVIYNLVCTLGVGAVNVTVTGSFQDTNTIDGNVILGGSSVTSNIHGISLTTSATACTITNNRCGGLGSGIALAGTLTSTSTISGNNIHSGATAGINFGNTNPLSAVGVTILNNTCWRNSGSGVLIVMTSSTASLKRGITIDGLIAYGNSGSGVGFSGNGHVDDLTLQNCVFNAGVTVTQPVGFSAAAGVLVRCRIDSCDFGVTTTHSTGDIDFPTGTFYAHDIKLRNCRLASATEISGTSRLSLGTKVTSQKHDQVAGAHKTWMQQAITSSDTSIYGDASPSVRITPSSASVKSEYPAPKAVAVDSGATVTVAVKVRRSVVGDGTASNSALPRLIQKANPSIGLTADVVLATATVACDGGSGEVISGTTAAASGDDGVIEFAVDCDGTTGWVNVDDWKVLA